jgi:hypothetical protein
VTEVKEEVPVKAEEETAVSNEEEVKAEVLSEEVEASK